jgi:acetolactate synthase-1/2/3 large subunit
VVSFRRQDLFPNSHALYAGDLGLANPVAQLDAFRRSDLILALGTRHGDISSQGYSFPELPIPAQTLVHCYPDDWVVGQHYSAEFGLVCDPVELARALLEGAAAQPRPDWCGTLRTLYEDIAAWPSRAPADGIDFNEVVRALHRHGPRDLIVTVDAGTFAVPAYRHFPWTPPQRLMAPLSGAMGYGVPAAIATQLRHPDRRVVCLVGDGGFMMTGNEMIAAVERQLPILFILSNNASYASIRIHQDREYPGRHRGTSLFNPDFAALAAAFGMRSQRLSDASQVDSTIAGLIGTQVPAFLEVSTSLQVVLPAR